MGSLADPIHEASLAILADPGIRLQTPSPLAMPARNGCRVDGDRVLFDEDRIMASLSTAAAAFP